jgi:CMP-N-acetylneuraminic acid synthetase
MKNFKTILGRKLYEYMLNAKEANCFDQIFVDTDNIEIKLFAIKHHINVIDRDPKLALNSANGNDLLNHHRRLFPQFNLYFQYFVTAPFLKPTTISECVNHLLNKPQNDSILTATAINSYFWFAGKPINYSPKILPRSQDLSPVIRESTGLYGIRTTSLDKLHCRIGENPIFHLIGFGEALDIDSDFDLRLANKC